MKSHTFRSRHLATALAAAALAAPSFAQIVNPADKQRPPEQEGGSTIVTGERVEVSDFREEDRVGPYGQPEWTKFRRFPTTRVYVQPAGHIGFEYWMRPRIPRHGATTIETQYEVEFGLPGRFQLDLYLVRSQEGDDGPSGGVDQQKIELRWALADWDEIAFNPTLYFEIVNRDNEADKIEAKLLFGGELKPGWHWGANLVFEHELGGALENEHELTLGLSHTLADQRFSLGAELKATLVNEHADRDEFAEELHVGPSIQYRPSARMHMDLATLVGIGHDSKEAEAFVVIGYEF